MLVSSGPATAVRDAGKSPSRMEVGDETTTRPRQWAIRLGRAKTRAHHKAKYRTDARPPPIWFRDAPPKQYMLELDPEPSTSVGSHGTDETRKWIFGPFSSPFYRNYGRLGVASVKPYYAQAPDKNAADIRCRIGKDQSPQGSTVHVRV